jgi:hypothetical protein
MRVGSGEVKEAETGGGETKKIRPKADFKSSQK